MAPATAHPNTVSRPVTAPDHPDAALLALGAEHRALIAATHARPDLPKAKWRRLFAVEDRICALQAHTPAGLAVQFRVLWDWIVADAAENRHGAQPDSEPSTRLFWSLIQRLDALGP